MVTKEMLQNEKGYYAKHFAIDPSLKTNAQNLLWEFNNTKPDENEKRADILQRLFIHYELKMDLNQYVLIGNTLKAYLSYLYNNEKLELEIKESKLYWQTIS